MLHNSRFFIPLFLALLLASACTTPETLSLKPQQFEQLDGWDIVDHSPAIAAFQQSCTAMMKKQDADSLGLQMGQVQDWKPACAAAAQFEITDTRNPQQQEQARLFFETYFTPMKSISSRRPDGLFTGYYEIELNGSLQKTTRYRHPIYQKPPEYLRNFTRAEIDNGALENHNLELLWVDDPVRLFFMHIQGSGVVKLEDGTIIRVGYDGQNGHSYVSLGRWLIDNNSMTQEEVNAPAIKQWLYAHPDLAAYAMQQNPSYIYFKRRDDLSHTQGPIGAQNVPLTTYRSLAVDKRFYGYGMPIWIQTDLPEYGDTESRPLRQLMIAQDTGGAIRGAIRGDIFYGRGKEAESLAGYTNNRGNLWILLPKQVAAAYGQQ